MRRAFSPKSQESERLRAATLTRVRGPRRWMRMVTPCVVGRMRPRVEAWTSLPPVPLPAAMNYQPSPSSVALTARRTSASETA